MIIKHNEQKGLDLKEIFKNNKFPLIVRLSKLTLVARLFTIKLISWLFFFKFNRIYISGSVSSIWLTELTIAKVYEFKLDQNSDVPAS